MSFKCPNCRAEIYNRAERHCRTCGFALPAKLLLPEAEIRHCEERVERERRKNGAVEASRPVARSRTKGWLTVVWRAALCLLAVSLLHFIFALSVNSKSKSGVQLSLSYLSEINQAGHTVAFFAINNSGNQIVVCRNFGNLEILGQDKMQKVSCRTKTSDLFPGDRDIAQVDLPDTMKKPWRFSLYYQPSDGQQNYVTTSDWIKEPPGTMPAAMRLDTAPNR